MIWIIGGTRETAELVKRIKDDDKYVITAATDSEREFLDDKNLVVGRMDQMGMEAFIRENSIDMIVDLSHPYALEVTKNAKDAARKLKIDYIRYVRKKTQDTEGCIYLDSVEQCQEFLKSVKGCVFFTTGSKNIKDFESVRGNNRFVYRVLPATESIEECFKNNVKMKNIVAVLGPFSEDMNAAMFKEYGADYVVMKDSGNQGGTYEKIQACRRLNIPAVIIGRYDEHGLENIDEVVKRIRQRKSGRLKAELNLSRETWLC
ncbi:MAG: precorrin-6A reductase [Firmicutes bacterium]|nr:precorrin-6A reductase [Bacillota bacterium]